MPRVVVRGVQGLVQDPGTRTADRVPGLLPSALRATILRTDGLRASAPASPSAMCGEPACVSVSTWEGEREQEREKERREGRDWEANASLSAARCELWTLCAWQAAEGPEEGEENN